MLDPLLPQYRSRGTAILGWIWWHLRRLLRSYVCSRGVTVTYRRRSSRNGHKLTGVTAMLPEVDHSGQVTGDLGSGSDSRDPSSICRDVVQTTVWVGAIQDLENGKTLDIEMARLPFSELLLPVALSLANLPRGREQEGRSIPSHEVEIRL